MNEAIEIDGKWYDENFNEVSKPEVSKPTPRSVTMDGETFTEGQVSAPNSWGRYMVLSISEDGRIIKTQYVETYRTGHAKVGEIKEYPTAAQAEAIINERKRQDRAIGLQKIGINAPSVAFTLGFLAVTGNVWIEVPVYNKEEFEVTYFKLTGEDVVPHLGHGYGIRKDYRDREGFARPVEYRVAFPSVPEALSFPPDVNVCTNGNVLNVNNTNFLKNMLRWGFRIGRNRDNVEKIEANLPERYREDFRKGVAFAVAA